MGSATCNEQVFGCTIGLQEVPACANTGDVAVTCCGGNDMSDCTPRPRSLSKRTRFQVFERDGFTCQYCGKQPPDVVLHVDHIHPFSKGGSDDMDNLVTSCSDCNLGKSDRIIGCVSPRPDASLMLARAAQEISEVMDYRAMLEQRNDEETRLVKHFQHMFIDITLGDWFPAADLLSEAISKSGRDYAVVESALVATAYKERAGQLRNPWQRFFGGCFHAARRDAE